MRKARLGAVLTHPIQYYSPWLRDVSRSTDLTVFYAHRQTPEGQAQAGFGAAFEWDVPLLDGYAWRWLNNVSSRPGLSNFLGCDTPEVVELVREARFDALLMFGWNKKSFWQAAWGAALSKTPLLIRLDSTLNRSRSALRSLVKPIVYSAVLPRFADYLSPGERTDAYLRRFAVPSDRIHRLPHMIDVERFRQGAALSRSARSTPSLRSRWGVKAEDFVFLSVGKLIDIKRPRLLLEGFRRALEGLDGSKARLWIVGDGPLRHGLEEFCRENALPVDFLGFVNQSELPAVYAAADCLVLPSNETWGLVVNEAFACGIPAIVSREAGCAPELIVDDLTGWTLDHPDSDELARVLRVAHSRARSLPRTWIDQKVAGACYSTGTQRLLEVVESIKVRRST